MILSTIPDKANRIGETLVAEPCTSLHDLLQASAALHNHLCPRQVLGVRMGMYAGELLGLELPQTDKRLLTIVETDGCFADGVAVAANCWVGRRTMRVEDYGKAAATFVDTATGVALRLAPQANARQLAQACAPEAGDRWEAMLLGYQRLDAELLFCVERVRLKTPLAHIISRPGLRRACDRCGEEIINERELAVGREVLCQACAGRAYYLRDSSPDDPAATHDAAHSYAVPDRLESRVAQHPHELMALFDRSQQIVSQLDLDILLGTISEHARALVQAQAALLCLLTPDGEALQLAFSSGWDGVQLGVRQPTARGLAAQVVGDGSTVVTPTQCTNCVVLNKYGPGGCVAVPLRVGESTLGALCVVREPEQVFEADQAHSLRMLANAAAIAVTNARLADAARQEAARAAACAEREHLAAELHDNLAQTLAFLNLKASVLDTKLQEPPGSIEAVGVELAAMAEAIATAYAQVRAALTGLQRPPSAAGDLARILDQSVSAFRAATGIATDLVIADESALALSTVVQTQVKYIVQEALANIRRHAHARHVQVGVARHQDTACFVIADDGCGFEPRQVDVEHHLGLAIMHKRALRCGGELCVESAPGAGTRIVASFPLTQGAVPAGESV